MSLQPCGMLIIFATIMTWIALMMLILWPYTFKVSIQHTQKPRTGIGVLFKENQNHTNGSSSRQTTLYY